MAVSALLFDFGGTLDSQGTHWLDRFLAAYREAGVELKREELEPAFTHGTRAGYRAGDEIRSADLRGLSDFLVARQVEYLAVHGPTRFLGALEDAKREGGPVERISTIFSTETAEGLRKRRQVLSKLASRFRLGVVSNFYGNLEVVLGECGLLPLFNPVIDSARVGLFKPDRRIFVCALDALGLPAAKAAMVGDSIDKDCAPARSLGMRTVWLKGPRNAPGGAAEVADYAIGTLEELLELGW